MSGIFRIFIIILPLTISLAAYFLAAHVLFPARVGKTKAILQSMPARSFGVGLVNFSFFFIIAIILFSTADNVDNEFLKGVIMLPGLIILAFISIMLTFGLAGMTSHVGERIVPDMLPWKQTFWGTVCLSFACALPFIGWFLLFPYIGLVGIGAFILGIFQREPKS
jgi:sorbitol-specific phosphotransferase system component IIBC